jgi:hypothetical protein
MWRRHGLVMLIITLLLLVGLLAACAPAAPTEPTEPDDNNETPVEEPQLISSLEDVAFAFAIANPAGDKLLIAQPGEDTSSYEAFDTALCGTETLSIAYLSQQPGNDQNTYREISANFDNMPGYLYQVSSGTATADQTYLLCAASSGLPDSLLTQVDTVELGTDVKVKIAETQGRGVQNAATLASYDDGTQVLFVLFEPDGENLLFDIVIANSDYTSMQSYDYPATLSNNSAWRVDDGGVADPAWFKVMLGVNTQAGMGFIINWKGAEGENTVYLLDQGGTISETQLYYRYWSPA